jgi:nudix-type nucleoside diphosphatase (YffH/AdpP family)
MSNVGQDNIRKMSVEIHDRERGYDGFFKIDRLTTTHELHAGGTSRRTWEVFERGVAVAVVLYKSDSKEIVLVRQFRAPTLEYSETQGTLVPKNDGQLDEIIAGMQQNDETYAQCAIRETREETGYVVKPDGLELICQFYASPGGSSERIFLYYAVVTDADLAPGFDGTRAGAAEEGEDILVRHIPVSTFFADMVSPDKVMDSKVLIAAMLLRERMGRETLQAKQHPADGQRVAYSVNEMRSRRIVLRPGDFKRIDDVDAWVNSENTDMQMDRFVGRSVSAQIRYWGAARDDKGRVIDDTISTALANKMRGRRFSRIGTVHSTTSGDLYASHNVKRLFHVAAVKGVIGRGTPADARQIEMITMSALAAVEKRNRELMTTKCRSVLLPIFGTGDGGLSTEVAFPSIVNGIISFFRENKTATVLEVHVSAYSRHDVEIAMHHLGQRDEVIQPRI